ncbi:dihydroxy-acid dehydratase, partial [Salmonella enterica subsp. enterica serovar Anatum]|nr:dihydroxy-acid dehydratase [Salmonella enterica subsp. enterica serovar Anatum]
FDYHEVRTKRAIIENSRHVMLVVDHSKFGRNAMVNMGSISMVARNHGYLNNYKVSPEEVIRKPENATKKGSIAVLKGNIAPEGAV